MIKYIISIKDYNRNIFAISLQIFAKNIVQISGIATINKMNKNNFQLNNATKKYNN